MMKYVTRNSRLGRGISSVGVLSFLFFLSLIFASNTQAQGCNVEGGKIFTSDSRLICAGDGVEDLIDVSLDGNIGAGSAWVITDENGVILDLPDGPPFNFEGGDSGICLIWHLSFEGDLLGAEIGNNAADLQGCFDLSNPIRVFRRAIDGGEITTDDQTNICTGDGTTNLLTPKLDGAEGPYGVWLITDENGNILAFPKEFPIDLEAFDEGVIQIWHLSYTFGLKGIGIGKNVNDLRGCLDFSNPITVTQTSSSGPLAGGEISTEDETDICAGDGQPDLINVSLAGQQGPNSAWVITDAEGNILDLPAGPPFDFEGAEAGVCLIWHLSFEDGLQGAEVGANAGDLVGCYSLSNPISVTRNRAVGATISIAGEGDEITICSGDGNPDLIDPTIEVAPEGENSLWVITDTDGNITGIPDDNPPYDFEGADQTFLIWYFTYSGDITDPTTVSNVSEIEGCYALSNPITVNAQKVFGGVISSNGETEITVCSGDGIPDLVDVTIELAAEGENSVWVITDTEANITGLPSGPPFDFEGADQTFLIWYFTYSGDITDPTTVTNVSEIEGCFALSNAITVTPTNVSGGVISANGETEVTICSGDGAIDEIDLTIEVAPEGENSIWVITDMDGNIIELPVEEPPFDLEGADGTILIWYLTYSGDITDPNTIVNVSELQGCFALSNPITINSIQAPADLSGGTISTMSETTVCAGDGSPDFIFVDLEGAAGTNSAWVITDADGNILDLPAGPPFDFEGADAGVCLIWHLSFEDGLVGAEVGANAGDLQGCFSLSNPIEVTRKGVDGGLLMFSDSTMEKTICAGDTIADPLDVILSGTEGENSAWVITDEDLNILDLPAGPPFDLEGAPAGVCLIWHASFNDTLSGVEVGQSALAIEGCLSLSNAITVIRVESEELSGGTISTNDPTEICVGDGMADLIDVTVEGGVGSNMAWVVTDEDLNILALPASSPIDFEGAGGGVCLIWHLSFADGLSGAEVGANAADLEGCFSLSNAITVTRTSVSGGVIELARGGDAYTICAGDGTADPIDVTLDGAEGSNSAWVITDASGEILDLPAGPPFDLEGAPAGVCLIWHLSFEDGLEGAEVGMNAMDLSGCFALSNPITVTRLGAPEELQGGTISTNDPTEVCVGDGVADIIDVTVEGAIGTNEAWVITDDELNILMIADTNSFDFEGAEGGVCLIWHIAFEEGLVGAEVGANAGNLQGCFALSNAITVTRTLVSGGTIGFVGGFDDVTICVGDGMPDPLDVTFEDVEGSNSAWVITDEDLNILDLPAGPPFDLEGADPGVCLIWHLSFEDGLEGAAVGANAADLAGCFSLSNALRVVRVTDGPECGTIAGRTSKNLITDFEVFPNPATTQLTFVPELPAAGPVEIRVTGVSGNDVMFERFDRIGSGEQVSMDISSLPKGYYIIQMYTELERIAKPFIKQ